MQDEALKSLDTAKSRTTQLKYISIGYHIPAVRRRDRFYAKLEEERAKNQG